MPPLSELPSARLSLAAKSWMFVLRGYLVVAGGLVLARIVPLANPKAANRRDFDDDAYGWNVKSEQARASAFQFDVELARGCFSRTPRPPPRLSALSARISTPARSSASITLVSVSITPLTLPSLASIR